MPLKANDTDGAVTRKRVEAYVAAREGVTEVALSDAAATLTAAQLLNSKVFVQTPTAARTLTTATAALIVAALTDEVTGTSFEFTIVNKAAETHAITLAGGTSVTIEGSAAVAAASSGTFLGVVQSDGSVKVYRK
jgi:ferric-dicitrate binding protein FerR (iron transport regulator)